MKPVEIIKNALGRELTDEDGRPIEIELIPGLNQEEITRFESTLPCPLPEDVRNMLRFCWGIYGTAADVVDFTGQDLMFENRTFFPHGVPIASDGYGNDWVVDLSPDSTEFGPVCSPATMPR